MALPFDAQGFAENFLKKPQEETQPEVSSYDTLEKAFLSFGPKALTKPNAQIGKQAKKAAPQVRHSDEITVDTSWIRGNPKENNEIEQFVQEIGNTGFKAHPMAATAMWKAIQEAKSQGINVGLSDAWRSHEDQAAMFRKYGAGQASLPGHSSHQGGFAFDVHGDLERFRPIASKYGIENPWDPDGTPHEAHHFVYKGDYAKALDAEMAVSRKEIPILMDSPNTEILQGWSEQIAEERGINPELFKRLITQESGWNVGARSHVGAQGLGQVMPGTWEYIKGQHPEEFGDVSWDQYRRDERIQLKASAAYLQEQLETFGNWPQALAAYNAGPGAVQSGKAAHYKETKNYVANILNTDPETASKWIASGTVGGEDEEVLQAGFGIPDELLWRGIEATKKKAGEWGDWVAKGGRRFISAPHKSAANNFFLPIVNMFLNDKITPDSMEKEGYDIWSELFSLDKAPDNLDFASKAFTRVVSDMASGMTIGFTKYAEMAGRLAADKTLEAIGVDSTKNPLDFSDVDNLTKGQLNALGATAYESPKFLGMALLMYITKGLGGAGPASQSTFFQSAGLRSPGASGISMGGGMEGLRQYGLGAAVDAMAPVTNFVRAMVAKYPAAEATRAFLSSESPEFLRWFAIAGGESFNRNLTEMWERGDMSPGEILTKSLSNAFFDGLNASMFIPLMGASGWGLSRVLGSKLRGSGVGGIAGGLYGASTGNIFDAITYMGGGMAAGAAPTMLKAGAKRAFPKQYAQLLESAPVKALQERTKRLKLEMGERLWKALDDTDDPRVERGVAKFFSDMMDSATGYRQKARMKQNARVLREHGVEIDNQLSQTQKIIDDMTHRKTQMAKRVQGGEQRLKDLYKNFPEEIDTHLRTQKQAQDIKTLEAQNPKDPSLPSLKKSLEEEMDDLNSYLSENPEAKIALGKWKKESAGLQEAMPVYQRLSSLVDQAIPDLQKRQQVMQLTRERLKKMAHRIDNKPYNPKEMYNYELPNDLESPVALDVLQEATESWVELDNAIRPKLLQEAVDNTVNEMIRAHPTTTESLERTLKSLEDEISGSSVKDAVRRLLKADIKSLREGLKRPKDHKGPKNALTQEEIEDLVLSIKKTGANSSKEATKAATVKSVQRDPKADYVTNKVNFRANLERLRSKGDEEILDMINDSVRRNIQSVNPESKIATTEFESAVSKTMHAREAHTDELKYMTNELSTDEGIDAFTEPLSNSTRYLDGRIANSHMATDALVTRLSKIQQDSKIPNEDVAAFADKVMASLQSGDWRSLARYIGNHKDTIGDFVEPFLAVVKDITRVKSADNTYGFIFKNMIRRARHPRLREWAGDRANGLEGFKFPKDDTTAVGYNIAAGKAEADIKKYGFKDWKDFVYNYSEPERIAKAKASGVPGVTDEKVKNAFRDVLLGGTNTSRPLESFRLAVNSMYQADTLRHFFKMFGQLEGQNGFKMITADPRAATAKSFVRRGGKMVKEDWVKLGNLMESDEVKALLKSARETGKKGVTTLGDDLYVDPEVAEFFRKFLNQDMSMGRFGDALISASNAIRQTILVGTPFPYLMAQFSNTLLMGNLNVARTIGMYREGGVAIKHWPEVVADFMESGGQYKTFKGEYEMVNQMLRAGKSRKDLLGQDLLEIPAEKASQEAAEKASQEAAPSSSLWDILSGTASRVQKGIVAADESAMEPMMFETIRRGQVGAWIYKTKSLWESQWPKLQAKGVAREDAMRMVKRMAADEVNLMSGSLPRWWHTNAGKKLMSASLLTPQWTASRFAALETLFDGVTESWYATGGKALGLKRRGRSRLAHLPPELRNRARGEYAKFVVGAVPAALLYANVMQYLMTGTSTFSNPPGREWDIRVGDDTFISSPLFGFHKPFQRFLTPFTSAMPREDGKPGHLTMDRAVRGVMGLLNPAPIAFLESVGGNLPPQIYGRPYQLEGGEKTRHFAYSTLPLEDLLKRNYDPGYDESGGRDFVGLSSPKMSNKQWAGRFLGVFNRDSNWVRDAMKQEDNLIRQEKLRLFSTVKGMVQSAKWNNDPELRAAARDLLINHGWQASEKVKRIIGGDGILRGDEDDWNRITMQVEHPDQYHEKKSPTATRPGRVGLKIDKTQEIVDRKLDDRPKPIFEKYIDR